LHELERAEEDDEEQMVKQGEVEVECRTRRAELGTPQAVGLWMPQTIDIGAH